MNRMRGKSKEDGSAAKHCRIRSYHRFVASKEKPRQRELAGLLIAWVIQNPGCTPSAHRRESFQTGNKTLVSSIEVHWTLRKEVPMPTAQDLIERARMFEERAERACDPISRQHYREMAAHYRSLSVEHQEIKPEHELAH